MELTPRLYQLYIYEQALSKNTLAFFPTGSGKTLISILLIRHYLQQKQGLDAADTPTNKQLIAFIAPTKILVNQQRGYIAANCDGVVKVYTGETLKSKTEWQSALDSADIIVVTPELLSDAFERKLMRVDHFSLLILDECHNATGRNPMAIVCEHIRASVIQPRILGLTASPIQCKKSHIAERISQLESLTLSKLAVPPESMVKVFTAENPIPPVVLLRYDTPSTRGPFGIRSSDFVCNIHATTAHLHMIGKSITIPAHCPHALLHCFMRLRHADFIYNIFKLCNTLKTTPSAMAEFRDLGLPEDADLSEGYQLDELQQLVSQLLRIVEDCGILCALYSLRESIHPTSTASRYGKLSTHHANVTGTKRKQHSDYTLDTHLWQIDIENLVKRKNEILMGPFTLDSVMKVRKVGTHSLVECFVSLVAVLDHGVLAAAATDYRAMTSELKSTKPPIKAARAIVQICLDKLASGIQISFAVGSFGCLQVMLGKEEPELPTVGPLCTAIAAACDCILHVSKHSVDSIYCDISCEQLSPDAIPVINELDLDPYSALLSFDPAQPFQYSLISTKVKALISFLIQTKRSADWACVVFCRMRLTVISLKFLLLMLAEPDNHISGLEAIIPEAIVGQNKQSEQVQKLTDFKLGKFNLLLATDVAEEGLDVRTCQLIINFDLPGNLKSMVQRRGRARAVNSTMVILAPLTIEGNIIIDEIGKMLIQEIEVKVHMQSQLDMIVSKDIDICVDDGTSEDEVLPGSTPSFSTVAIKKISTFCQRLPRDSYNIPHPIYWIDRSDILYRCALLLPVHVPGHSRCFVSPYVAKKSLAKIIAATQSLERLQDIGVLEITGENTSSHVSISKEATVAITAPASTPGGAGDTSDAINIEIKAVPDCLAVIANSVAVEFGVMYLYAVKVSSNEPADRAIISACHECSSILNAFEYFGVALPHPVPDESLSSALNMSIRSIHRLTGELEFLGQTTFESADLLQIQRYHRSTLCWESENTSPLDAIIDKETWTRSSNGLLYLVFPLLPEFKTAPLGGQFINPPQWTEFLRREADAAQSLIYNIIEQKKRFAAELSAMPVKDSSTKAHKSPTLPLAYRGPRSAKSLEGTVFFLAPHRLFIGLCPFNGEEVTINDVMDPKAAVPKTFLEHYLEEGSIPPDVLQGYSADPNHRMIRCMGISGKLNGVRLLNRITSAHDNKVHRHAYVIHLIPEYCSMMGNALYYYVGLAAPCFAWRLKSLLLAQEARDHTWRLYKEYALAEGSLADSLQLPSIDMVLEAITPRMCLEIMDSERLELVGDSFLKFAVSVELFRLYPEKHEGELTVLRNKYISNDHQSAMAKNYNLVQFLRAVPVLSGKQVLNFEPPGRIAVEDNESLWNRLAVIPEETRGAQSAPKARVSTTKATRQMFYMATVKSKCLADLVESLIGAFCITGGYDAGVAAIKALGCWPKRDAVEAALDVPAAQSAEPEAALDVYTCKPSDVPEGFPPFLGKLARGDFDSATRINFTRGLAFSSQQTPDETVTAVSSISVSVVDALEKCLGYRFMNMKLLDLALTHTSVQYKPSNQRLEFLGDAVLDYAVVNLIYTAQPTADQGEISTQKSLATMNVALGLKAVQLRLYKYLKTMSNHLLSGFRDIEELMQESEATGIPIEAGSINDSCLHALADLVEALFGAAYLDSGGDAEFMKAMVLAMNILPQIKGPWLMNRQSEWSVS